MTTDTRGKSAVTINLRKKHDDNESEDGILCCSGSGALDKRKKKFTRKQKMSLVMLALVDFMSYCSMSLLAPFYPAVSAQKGMTETMSGMIFGYYALVIFVSSPVIGKVLPKFGTKNIFITGLFLSGFSDIFFGLIGDIEDYTLFAVLSFAIRGFVALGSSAFSTAAYVLVINIFPDNAAGVRGILETFVGLGLCVGPGIGGVLFTVGGFGLPFYVVGTIMLITAFLNMYVLDQPEKHEVEKSGSMINLLKLPAVLITCMIMIVTSMTFAYLDPTLEPHMRKFSFSPSQVGLLFLLVSATYGMSSPVWGWLTDRVKNYTWMMTTGLICNSFVLLFFGPSPVLTFLEGSIWSNIAALPALGFFVAMSLIPTYQFILDSSMENGFEDTLGTHSIIAGIWSSVYSLGEMIGPTLSGYLMEHFGFPITSTTFAFINFTAGVIAFIYFRTRNITSKVLAQKSEKKGVDNVIFYLGSSETDKEVTTTTPNTGSFEDSNVISVRL